MGWYVLAADAPVMRCLKFGADNSCEWSRLSGYECQIVCRVVRHHSSTLQSSQQPAMTFCLKSARNATVTAYRTHSGDNHATVVRPAAA